MTGKLLDIDGVSVAYGKVQAVNGVSLSVGLGEIVTVIGANGAGKSTLLNAAMGVLRLASGTVRFRSQHVSRAEVEERVSLGLSLVPERRELFSTMTVEDNLRLGGFGVERGLARDALARIYDRFPPLKERRTQRAGTLSGGERQMLAMGRALMGNPKLLMLDEPSLGLAPRIVADIFRIVAELKSDGVSILLVEQNARAALAAADRAYVMELGCVIISGPACDLARDERVVQSYLGLH